MKSQRLNAVVFGGQYGSEGKGSLSEWLAKNREISDNLGSPERLFQRKLAVFGENAPNSGHTCSAGKTQNIPAASFYADVVILGPDSIIDVDTLLADSAAVNQYQNREVPIYVHLNAGLMKPTDKEDEAHTMRNLIGRISSTGSGSGACRERKYMLRLYDAVVGATDIRGIRAIGHSQYLDLLRQISGYDRIFECSQGVLLDTNWGMFPYVTSRTTLPRVAIERNGLGHLPWKYYGVYRTYPIRTGGPSGPTGEMETTFEKIGVAAEIATVTKRTRRIFEFSADDFERSVLIARPDVVAFTHLDYIRCRREDVKGFRQWLDSKDSFYVRDAELLLSDQLGMFYEPFMGQVPIESCSTIP